MFENIVDNDFIQIYKAFKESALKISANPDDTMERLRHAKLTAKMDKTWREFTREKKEELMKILLPEKVVKLIEKFEGSVKLT